MIRSVLLSFALLGMFLPACAGSRSSSPPPVIDSSATTTSGIVGAPLEDLRDPGACGVTDTLCTSDEDCCSVFCVSGQCEPRAR